MTNDNGTSPIATGSLLGGRYRLGSAIGHGGMATVYRGHDEHLDRPVAVKVFTVGADPVSDARQDSEVRLLASFDHPGLVTLYDRIAGERPALVMQFVDGEDLRTRLQRGALGTRETAAIGADVAAALAYVHERGVLHRDVTPANVLLPTTTEPGDPVALLADFGIARLVDAATLTATGTVLGTATYLSPEQAAGSTVTSATDIYSLGLVLLEGLTGERAYPGGVAESLVARLSADPGIPDDLDPGIAAILRAATAREPEDRPTATDLSSRLRDLATGTAVFPAPVSPAAVIPATVSPTAALPATVPLAAALPPTEVLPAAEVLAPTLAMPVAAATTPVVGDDPGAGQAGRTRSARRWVAPLVAIAAGLALLIGVVSALAISSALNAEDTSPAAAPAETSAPTEEAATPEETVVAPPEEPEMVLTVPDLAGPAGPAAEKLFEALSGTGLEGTVVELATRAAAGDREGAIEMLDALEDDLDEVFDDKAADEVQKLIDKLEDALQDDKGPGPKKD